MGTALLIHKWLLLKHPWLLLKHKWLLLVQFAHFEDILPYVVCNYLLYCISCHVIYKLSDHDVICMLKHITWMVIFLTSFEVAFGTLECARQYEKNKWAHTLYGNGFSWSLNDNPYLESSWSLPSQGCVFLTGSFAKKINSFCKLIQCKGTSLCPLWFLIVYWQFLLYILKNSTNPVRQIKLITSACFWKSVACSVFCCKHGEETICTLQIFLCLAKLLKQLKCLWHFSQSVAQETLLHFGRWSWRYCCLLYDL